MDDKNDYSILDDDEETKSKIFFENILKISVYEIINICIYSFFTIEPREKFVATRIFYNSENSDEKKSYISKLEENIHSRNAPLIIENQTTNQV